MTMVTIPTLAGDAAFTGYIARPQGAPQAAVIVIQEIFGVNPASARNATSWPPKATSRSRPICSGG